MITKGGYIWIFSIRILGYMSNNIHFVALHVLDVHNAFFSISSQSSSVKFDDVFWCFWLVLLFEFAAPRICL